MLFVEFCIIQPMTFLFRCCDESQKYSSSSQRPNYGLEANGKRHCPSHFAFKSRTRNYTSTFVPPLCRWSLRDVT